jgi:hypothetical protein
LKALVSSFLVLSVVTTVFLDIAQCSLIEFTDVSEVLAASIIKAIEADCMV